MIETLNLKVKPTVAHPCPPLHIRKQTIRKLVPVTNARDGDAPAVLALPYRRVRGWYPLLTCSRVGHADAKFPLQRTMNLNDCAKHHEWCRSTKLGL